MHGIIDALCYRVAIKLRKIDQIIEYNVLFYVELTRVYKE